MSIPTHVQDAAEYKASVATILAKVTTHVYVDTSFLMWATKIGPTARGQLLLWMRGDVGARIHVPLWAGHEYLRHHVARTLLGDLQLHSGEVADVAKTAFAYFRPFLDDPALPVAEGWEQLRASTREATNTFTRLAEFAKKWRKAYPAHAEQIITFINERVLPSEGYYPDLATTMGEGAARFEGRIPPGFQDRNKRAKLGGDPEGTTQDGGANRYGDLIFWKEAMAHAVSVDATAVVILTNDLKNDWRMGGGTTKPVDETMKGLRKSWRPVPAIHPMLALEAKVLGIANVALLDSQYLAAYLQDVDAEGTGALADVAIVPDPPAPPTAKEERASNVERRVEADRLASFEAEREAGHDAREAGFLYADDPAVGGTRFALKKALLGSRNGADGRGEALLARMRSDVGPVEAVEQVLTKDALAGMDHVSLASMTRTLHDRVLAGEPGLSDAVVDLVGLLHVLPPLTAGAMTLGLLASMYVEPGASSSRLPPASPARDLLFARLGAPYAEGAVRVVSERLEGNPARPLFVPSDAAVPWELDVDPEGSGLNPLLSLKIAGVETLTVVEAGSDLSLRGLLKGETARSSEILDLAANVYALPRERLATDEDATEFLLGEDLGFRAPEGVFRASKAS